MMPTAALKPLSSPRYRPLFAAMVLTLFAQGAWTLYLAMQVLDLGADPWTLAGVLAATGQLRSDVEMQPRFHTTRGGHFRHPVRNPEV